MPTRSCAIGSSVRLFVCPYADGFHTHTLPRAPRSLAGAFDLDLSYVRAQPGHEIFRRWVALSDTTGERKGVQGYVRLSAVALGPAEVAPAHTDKEEEDEDIKGSSLQSMVLTPPEIKTEVGSVRSLRALRAFLRFFVSFCLVCCVRSLFFVRSFVRSFARSRSPAHNNKMKPQSRLLKVRVFQARDLPNMDVFRFWLALCRNASHFRPLKSRTRALTDSKGSDAFVQVSFAGATQKTSTVEHSLNPTWNQELALPVTLPAMTDKIDIAVFDSDKGSKPDMISQLQISFATQLPVETQWLTLYGGRCTALFLFFPFFICLEQRRRLGQATPNAQ